MRKFPALAGIASLLVAFHPATAQIDMKAMATMDGRCQAEIEAKPGSCQPVGTFVEFGNGRSLFLFSREGTLYSFSGDRLQPRGLTVIVLTVDMVRITSQTAPERALADATGECVAQMDANTRSFTRIECAAQSRSTAARYRFLLDQISNFERRVFQ